MPSTTQISYLPLIPVSQGRRTPDLLFRRGETDIIILLIAIMMVRSKQPLRPDLILAATLRLAYIRFVSEVCFQSFISITAAIN